MAVKTYNNEIARAYSQGANVAAIYSCGEKVWPTEQQGYHIRGTSTATTETLNINNVNVVVDVVNGAFDYEYSEPITSANNMLHKDGVHNTTITSIDFTNADNLNYLVDAYWMFNNATALRRITFGNQTLQNVENAEGMFASLVLNELTMPNVNFLSVVNIDYLFYKTKINYSNTLVLPFTFQAVNTAKYAFQELDVAALSMPNATLANVVYANLMFYKTKATTLNLPNATFNDLQIATDFMHYANFTSLYLPNAIFAGVTNCRSMFNELEQCTIINLPNATFASATDLYGIFSSTNSARTTLNLPNATFASATSAMYFSYNCRQQTAINMPNATFANNANTNNMFTNNISLADFVCGENSVKKTFTMQWCPLTYQSMLNVCNWLANVTTTQTITFKSSAWAALTTDQQNTLTTIATAKNWTIATA